MKKLLLSVAIISVLSACKKESTATEATDAAITDSANIVVPEESTVAAVPFKKVEWSADETTKMLSKKDNDTLYVTNFWATWCPPCIREIPHFKAKMTELKSQPVKFTFVSLDPKEDWDTKVKNFSEEHGLSENVILLDGSTLAPGFFAANFKKWDGGSIPFTFMRKGDKTDETVGMMSEEALTEKINSFK